MEKYWRNKKVSIPTVIVIAIVLLLVVNHKSNGHQTSEVVIGDFVRETRVSGKVRPLDEAKLSFNTSGQVATISVKVGDEVKRGDVLATLDRSDLSADLSQAQANLLLEQRQLTELNRGTRQEEIDVQKAKVELERKNYSDALTTMVNTLKQSYTSAVNLYNIGISQVFDNPFKFNARISPQMSVRFSNSINDDYQDIREIVRKFGILISTLSTETYSESTRQEIDGYLAELQSFSNKVAIAVGEFEPVSGITQEDIDRYRSDLASQRNSLDTSIISASSAGNELSNSEDTLRIEEENLRLLTAGSTPEDLAIQQARILSEQAKVSSASASLRDSQIIAPFDGVIAKKEISVGENVTSDIEAFVLVAENGMEIESFIPELLIADVTKGDTTSIVFDAYPDKTFNGTVSSVDPKDTLRDGVSTYKTIIQFDDLDDTPIRVGMTVDLLIEALRVPDVLLVPSRAIITERSEEGRKYYVVVGREKVEVEVGERDSHGNREVLGGISEGDVVVLDPED